MDEELEVEVEVDEQSSPKMVRTTLDDMEYGTDEMMDADRNATRAERRKLPDGVSSKQLYKDVVRIAWPSLVEMTLAGMAAIVDMMLVGVLGNQAVSAVGLATQPRFIFVSLLVAVNAGSTAVIARARGAGDHVRAERILRQSLMLAAILSVFGTVVGYFTAESLIRVMAAGGMTEETIRLGTSYLKVEMLGFSTVALPVCITAALRGTGNSRIPMVYNMISSVIDAVFSYLLIHGKLGFPAWGIAGGAIATIMGQTVALGLAFYAITNGRNYFSLNFREGFRPDLAIIRQISKIGLPALGEQAIMRVGFMLFAMTVMSLGEAAATAHGIAINVQSLSFNTGMAFAAAATSLVGQSLGRKRPDMAEQYGLRCRRLGLYVSLALMVMFAVLGQQVYQHIYMITDSEVIIMGGFIMLFVATLQPIQSTQFVLAGVLRGAGDTRSTAIIMLLTVLLVRPIIAFGLVTFVGMGIYGAWCAIAVDQCLRSFLVYRRYISGKWKHVRV